MKVIKTSLSHIDCDMVAILHYKPDRSKNINKKSRNVSKHLELFRVEWQHFKLMGYDMYYSKYSVGANLEKLNLSLFYCVLQTHVHL